ncbi:MAG TPA: protein-L-isoaspartate(D-aspartate) O-methyltransferase [Dehalococcoidia bacterium]|nr:protein-L-isoaspartate(D-aspartate) O-methyltransferase [Dehalococcoidia bacterium]
MDAARARLVDDLRREVHDERVLAAIGDVRREDFVPDDLRRFAYEDRALPIGEGQTISQPLIVALMTEAIEPQPGDRVLELGTGSGYQAAVLSRLVREVITVERVEALLERARVALSRAGCDNVRAFEAGETLGRPEDAPYDAIIVTAAAPHVPQALLAQLAPGGRMVLPVGDRRAQELVRVRKDARGGIVLERLGACAFVPLIGAEAFAAGDPAEASRRFKVR